MDSFTGKLAAVTGGGSGMGRGLVSNVDSDTFWQSVIGSRVIPRLLAVRTGPGGIGPLRQLITGSVAGYDRYLASVAGPRECATRPARASCGSSRSPRRTPTC